MLLTTQHIYVSTGTALKGNLVRLGHFNWQEGDSAPRNLMASLRSTAPPSLNGPLANSSKPLTLVRSCCVESSFCSVGFAQYFSTRVPVSGFIRASGNSERCNMTGHEDNVGFLATGSGVKQFQLSLGGWFVPQERRLSATSPRAGNGSTEVFKLVVRSSAPLHLPRPLSRAYANQVPPN
jgi:hypothetical protein